MKTPYLDKEIQFLKESKRNNTASFYQQYKLAEYEKIKETLKNL